MVATELLSSTCLHLCQILADSNALPQVFGVATEDMDALTFGTPRLIRNFMAPASAKVTVTEYDYDKVRHASQVYSLHA